MDPGEDGMKKARREARLALINKKGLEIANQLVELKAGRDVALLDLGRSTSATRKEDRLRAYLSLINEARARLVSGGYGLCLTCSSPLGEAQLDELPWADICVRCELESG